MSRAPLARQTPPPPIPDDEPEPRPVRFRRRILMAMTYVLLAAAVLFAGRYVRADDGDLIVVPAAPAAARPSTEVRRASPAPSRTAAARAAGTGGTFTYLAAHGRVLGTAGPIRRFHVGVEEPVAAGAPAAFAAEIDRTLGDRRSWIASGRFRLQRVSGAEHAEFTIYLASARTSERMCRTGGLETGAYTSCRLPGKVIVNDDRWEGAVRGYGAALATYRSYVINHEVGHQLGHGHEACPGKGRRAPVMMQQTYGLKGCVPNSWPYPDGRRYSGPPAA